MGTGDRWEREETMRRFRSPEAILLTLMTGMLPLGANARPRNTPSYNGQVDFGAQLLYREDGCLSVHGAVTAGNFFDDLRRVDKDGQLEYRKHGKLVTEYPESLTTSIRIAGDPCIVISNSPSALFRGDSFSLKLEVYWKHEMQLRPAVISPLGAHCIGYASVTMSGQTLTTPSIGCQLTVDSKGVPLADHLIVSILGSDGRPLTRISAAP